MKKSAVIVVFALLVSGCAEKQLGDMSYPEQTALLKRIFDRCEKEAPPAGSPQNKYCFSLYVQQEQSRRQQSAQRANGAMAGIAEGLAGAGASYNAGASAYSAPAYQPQRYCSSSMLGATTSNPTVTTTCY